jgi:hypothetical protein
MKTSEVMLLETVVISMEVFGRKVTVFCKNGEVFCFLSFNSDNHLIISCKQDILLINCDGQFAASNAICGPIAVLVELMFV